VLYLLHLEKKIEELYGKLETKRRLPSEEYSELCRNLNEVVREARRSRSSWLDRIPKGNLPKDIAPEDVLPESFLVRLLRGRIERTVRQFLKRHPDFYSKTPDWMKMKACIKLAEKFVRTIILGDHNKRNDIRSEIEKFLENQEVSEEKLIKMNYLWAKAHRDALLGQKGSHKKKGYLIGLQTPEIFQSEKKLSSNFDLNDPWAGLPEKDVGFQIKDLAAIKVTQEIALQYKKRTKRSKEKNSYEDEPTGYDPGYLPPETRYLLKEEAEVNLMIKMWEEGEFKGDLVFREDLIAYIESQVIRRSIADLTAEIRLLKTHEPDLIGYIFGNIKRRGRLYRRLCEIARFRKRGEVFEADRFQKRREVKQWLEKNAFQETESNVNNLRASTPDPVDNIAAQEKREPAKALIEEIKKHLTKAQMPFFRAVYVDGHKISDAAKYLGYTRENAYKHNRNILSLARKNKPLASALKNLLAPRD